MSDVKNTFILELNLRLETLLPGLSDSLSNIATIDPEIANRALGLLLDHACKAQNAGVITWARTALTEMPEWWLEMHLRPVAEAYINFEDEWEYRRLIELLRACCPNLITHFIQFGLASGKQEVRDSAEDFLRS